MAQIREIKRRIKSVNNTSKVTHAMELVAAAKMRKSQEAALTSRPYTNSLNEMLIQVRKNSQEQKHALLTDNESKETIVMIITTDRGLVGGLNVNLFREILQADLKNAQFVTVGKKALMFATKTGANVIASFVSDEHEPLQLARTLTKVATDAYIKNGVGSIEVFYTDYQSTIKQVPTHIRLLPIEFETSDDSHPRGESTLTPESHPGGVTDLIFEPSADQILESILPHYLLTKMYQVILETKASEHSSRMIAMKNATDAANELVDDLTLAYNQARQETITTELLDIITAQKAFE